MYKVNSDIDYLTLVCW